MFIKDLNKEGREIKVAMPLTTTSGKIRIKDGFVPVATRQTAMSSTCYVEWQIGYDVKVSDTEKLKLSTLTEKTFIGSNGNTKCLYELSEYVKYFRDWGIISNQELLSLKEEIRNIHNFIENTVEITRTAVQHENFNGLSFASTKVEYPSMTFDLGSNYKADIQIKEKQYAVGIQPMLYVCFPISELGEDLIGRTADKKEMAEWCLKEDKKDMLLNLFRVFGMLSESHNQDIQNIIDLILNF